MRCIQCGNLMSKVIDSRSTDDGRAIRRRRECELCGRRFTTYETIETTPMLVIKSNGNRQQYDSNKLKIGIIKACEKRPVSISAIDKLVADITKQLEQSMEGEISSKKIGGLVMDGLKLIDEISYIRFASVYRQFKDSQSFMEELQLLFNQSKKT